ncbi:hypothetical protein [Rhizobium sp. CIAT894]|uniref:hypothetical protein n=1 Tax=Rhizobium sp. CIAT894 TaxID=2020312 RepID=UPI000F7384DC|nr:hypothetical protein [Rhizobium sp. CIAT894]
MSSAAAPLPAEPHPGFSFTPKTAKLPWKWQSKFQTILKTASQELIDFNFIIKIFLLRRKRI